jgi:hypothetical protein
VASWESVIKVDVCFAIYSEYNIIITDDGYDDSTVSGRIVSGVCHSPDSLFLFLLLCSLLGAECPIPGWLLAW